MLSGRLHCLTVAEAPSLIFRLSSSTNIGLSKHYFSYLFPKLKEGRKAFTINRVTMYANTKKANMTVLEPTTDQAKIERMFSEIDVNIGQGSTRHPGTDVFFMSSSIVDSIHLGKQFPGFGHWAVVLKLILRDILAKDDFSITESSPWGSFHIGDDIKWKTKVKENDRKRLQYVKKHFREQILLCPAQEPLHSSMVVMNQVGCGLAFKEHYRDFLTETRGGICRYSFTYGWYHGESAECDNFVLRNGDYPWGDHEKPDPLTPYENFGEYPDQIPKGGALPPL